VNCLEFRRAIGAEPFLGSAELQSHQASCAACARFAEEMRAFDKRIHRALLLDLDVLDRNAEPHRPARARLALAASLAVAVLLASGLWLSRPAPTLAAQLAAHIAHEPEALSATVPLPPARVHAVLSQFGIALRGDPGAVVYARSCTFAGRDVPHLVVSTAAGPVTVMLLQRSSAAPERIAMPQSEGWLLPAGRGSIAVLGDGIPDLEGLARRIEAALVWQDR